ncbi:hypothetical protein FBU30_000371 [Linnemannia zychae]|nr:hypothetical protein FBU30_000371 [Linnemannia zychae]
MAVKNEGIRKPVNNRAVFRIGLARFSKPGNKHSAILKRFIKRARALEHMRVGLHEYFTAAKCPRPIVTSS